LKVDHLAPRVDEPILGNAGQKVSTKQIAGILPLGIAADDLHDQVRRAVDFDESQAAVDRFALLGAPLARLLSLNYGRSGSVERYRIRVDRQSAIGQRVAEV
jgi:hypothetical protein